MEIEASGGSARPRRLSDDGRDAWTGLTLGAVLQNNKKPPVQVSRTLIDIIREEEPNSGAYKNLINHHNNKNWKSFKDRLFLRRAGNAWTSSVHIPTSDTFSVQNNRSQLSRRDSTRSPTRTISFSGESGDNNNTCSSRPQMSRMTSSRVMSSTGGSIQCPIITEPNDSPEITEFVQVSDAQSENSRSQMLRRNSSRLPTYQATTQSDPFNEPEETPGVRLSAALAAEREQIQRVVSSSESTSEPEHEEEQENRVTSTSSEETPAPAVRMSLMDLLEETDREMGWGSYTGEDEEEEEEEEEEVKEEKGEKGGAKEYDCCVCMVRHKGAAFIPCGHTFCRLCSRELFVARGNCPLCNAFILEILDIF